MTRTHACGLIALTLIAPLTGCTTAKVAEPLTLTLAGNDTDSQMAFWHDLNARPIVCNDEAFHALLLLADGQDDSADFTARTATLMQKNLLEKTFRGQADDAVTRGTVAHIAANILSIKGGLMMRLTRGTPRYALREMVFLNIFPPSSEQQTLTGDQFVSIIGRLQDYQQLSAIMDKQPLTAAK
ncbi:MAG: hypothetical protein GC164_13640 [Phycisphaera sp.]|nr:hypothetical protein [Phycisphaera sp.]